MRIIRENSRWRLLSPECVVHDCLESLAMRQGYRVGEVCGELGVSAAYFREIFLRDVGMTPKEWMQWERMVVARRLLAWGVDPLEVADRLGFNHPNSFRREFRRVHGVSPWRFAERETQEAPWGGYQEETYGMKETKPGAGRELREFWRLFEAFEATIQGTSFNSCVAT